MKVARSLSGGYTIVESLIFLAVTGMLFAMAAVTIKGQQQRAEFNQGVRDLESRIQDIMNDVATGYYTNTNTFNCTATPLSAAPTINPGVNDQGANLGCIFMGRAVQFGVAGSDRRDYVVFTVVGKQRTPGGISPREVENYGEAVPTAVRFTDPALTDPYEQERIGGGISVEWVRRYHGGAAMDIGTVGLFGTLSKSTNGVLNSGSSQLDIVAIPATSLDESPEDVANDIDDLKNTVAAYTTPPVNVDGGIVICLQNNSRAQHALLTIGGNNRRQSTSLEFKEGNCI